LTMTPALRKAGKPAFRKSGFCASAACTIGARRLRHHTPPPEISYDNAAPAVQTADPPRRCRSWNCRALPLPAS
jgi:type IV secretion system protein VirB9